MESTLATYASPVFGALSVADVDTAMVVKVLEPIWADNTETAVRLRGRIESILDWATVSKFRSGENPARWRGHLDYLLANPSKVAPVVNHPALAWAEAPMFMNELREREGVAARALEFAVYTAARSGEVRGAWWTEIDWESALWTVPARESSRMPIASDIGDCLFTALDIENTALVAPGYYATMGYDVPAGMGLQAGGGERPLILVGDGAFQMTGWELGNCQRYGWDPIVIVFNNCSWQMLHAFQPDYGFSDLSDLHFADMAEPLGGQGYRVSTRRDLQDALRQAVAARGKFQLIEAMIPRGMLSDTLARFVRGVRRLQQPATRRG